MKNKYSAKTVNIAVSKETHQRLVNYLKEKKWKIGGYVDGIIAGILDEYDRGERHYQQALAEGRITHVPGNTIFEQINYVMAKESIDGVIKKYGNNSWLTIPQQLGSPPPTPEV